MRSPELMRMTAVTARADNEEVVRILVVADRKPRVFGEISVEGGRAGLGGTEGEEGRQSHGRTEWTHR